MKEKQYTAGVNEEDITFKYRRKWYRMPLIMLANHKIIRDEFGLYDFDSLLNPDRVYIVLRELQDKLLKLAKPINEMKKIISENKADCQGLLNACQLY